MSPAELSRLLDLQAAALWHLVAVFLRVGPVMGLVPGFSEQAVPVRIRLGLAIAMTLIVAPLLPPTWAGPEHFGVFVTLAATETACGLVLGLGLRIAILCLQTAGAMAAQAVSLSQILGGAGVEPLPAIGHVLVMAGLALAMMMGLHLRVATYIVASYDFLPSGRFPDPAATAQWGLDRVAEGFALAFRLAMPFVVVSVLYNLTLGVINRAMPQLMVALVGTPAITAGGLILLAVTAPAMVSIWTEALMSFLAEPTAVTP